MEISNAAKRSSWSIDGLSSRFEKSHGLTGSRLRMPAIPVYHVRKQTATFLVDVFNIGKTAQRT